MRYRLLLEYGAVLRELSLRKLIILFLDDMDALCPMLRGCIFGMSSFDDTADTQHILRYHGCCVKCQALILQKLSKLTQYQPNRRRKKPYEVKLQQQGCLSYGNRKIHFDPIQNAFMRNLDFENFYISRKGVLQIE